ncbi:MAG: hypothetical protein HYV09_20170 [Deltaproteobacteria bacterium]|nr:hypothetical protein [Deltaproteobacteria bacterium]
MTNTTHAVESRAELARPASVVVGHALRLVPGEKVVLICDRGSRDIAAALVEAARSISADAIVADLDELGARPHKIVPHAWSFALALAHASVFVASSPPDELPMRQHLLHLVSAQGLRHAHMPAITHEVFVRGIRVPRVDAVARGQRVLERLSRARRLRSTSPLGTDLHVTLGRSPGSDRVRWWAQLGVLEPGRWGNLPAGAIFATPSSVDGVLVVNASLGEWFGRREGVLEGKPVRLRIADGRIVDVLAPHSRQLERDLESLLEVAPSSARIGLVCIGVNESLEGAAGYPLVDQNLPGLHVGVGDPAARVTGARWSAPTSFAACQVGSTVEVDGVPLVSAGRLLVDD